MGALRTVEVPDLGDFSDVPIVEVLVTVGDEVAEGAALVEIESDKATMEVPAPFAGVVRELHVAVGDKVSAGTPLAAVEAAEGADAPPDREPVPAGDPPQRATSESTAPTALESAISAEAQTANEHPQPLEGAPASEVHASPVARRMARVLGVDLASVEGTGRLGRITKEDVEAAAQRSTTTRPLDTSRESVKGLTPDTSEESVQLVDTSGGGVGRVAMTRIQRLSRKQLERAWREIPHVTQHEDADVTELEAFRQQLNAEQQDVKVTMVALLLKAVAATLDAFPRFASSLDGDEVVLHAERHLGFAVDTPDGLVVPVLRDVDAKGILAVAGELRELSGRARDGKLGPKDISGAVFTLSSLGGIGGTAFTPIVNPPQVAILGASRTQTRPVWDGGAFQPRLLLPLSLSYDHRVIDGAAAARFCAHLAGVLGDLRRALL